MQREQGGDGRRLGIEPESLASIPSRTPPDIVDIRPRLGEPRDRFGGRPDYDRYVSRRTRCCLLLDFCREPPVPHAGFAAAGARMQECRPRTPRTRRSAAPSRHDHGPRFRQRGRDRRAIVPVTDRRNRLRAPDRGGGHSARVDAPLRSSRTRTRARTHRWAGAWIAGATSLNRIARRCVVASAHDATTRLKEKSMNNPRSSSARADRAGASQLPRDECRRRLALAAPVFAFIVLSD